MIWNVGANVTSRPARPWGSVGIVAAAGLVISGHLRLRRAQLPDPDALSSQRASPVVRWETLDLRPGCSWSNQDGRVLPGKVEPDGRFSIKSGAGEGAPEGEYPVRIEPELQPRDRGPSQKGSSESAFSREVCERHDIRSESHRQARREQPGTVQARSGAVSGKVRK